MHVFTYGTLMFPEIWQTVVGRRFTTVEGVAKGFAVYRVRRAVFPGIKAAEESDVVRGVVYLDVDHAAIAKLDLFEDEFYERRSIWIDCSDGERRAADTYIVPPAQLHVLTDEPWHRSIFLASGGLAQFVRHYQGFPRAQGSADQ